MGQDESSRACWFGAGLLIGAVAAGLCAARACGGRLRVAAPDDVVVPDDTGDTAGARAGAAAAATTAATIAATTAPLQMSPAAAAAAPVAFSPVESPEHEGLGPETGSDMFEYRGFVIHLYWQTVGPGRYKSWCDIWEAGAIVQEAGGPPATYPTAAEARMAGGAWARHWVQSNG